MGLGLRSFQYVGLVPFFGALVLWLGTIEKWVNFARSSSSVLLLVMGGCAVCL